MKITPRNALVTIRWIDPPKDTKVGRIYLPAVQGQQFKLAEVVAVGRGTPEYNTHVGTDDLRPGQTVLCKAGHQVDLGRVALNHYAIKDDDGREIALINQHDIIAIIEDSELKFAAEDDSE